MANDVNQEHGPHRRPVGGAGTVVSPETPGRWARPTVARYASGAERCLLGFAHRRSLARFAASLSSLPNLSSPLPAVGTGGKLEDILRVLARPWKIATGGGFHRRLLHRGKKGGLAVGLTKRGKGTKIIALTVFLSPLVSKALRRTKVSSSKASSGTASSTSFPNV